MTDLEIQVLRELAGLAKPEPRYASLTAACCSHLLARGCIDADRGVTLKGWRFLAAYIEERV
jgi:hypothetical protein